MTMEGVRKVSLLLACAAAFSGCGDEQLGEAVGILGNKKAERAADEGPAPVPNEPTMKATADGPRLGAVRMKVTIYARPDHRSEKIGYLRVGGTVPRAAKPAAYDSCQGGFFNILPRGYVCLDDGATNDLNHPLVRADLKPPARDKPLPYTYGFVRAIAPRYYRLPTEKEQYKYEMSLKRHLRSFKRLEDKWNGHTVGSNDVRIMPEGVVLGPPPEEAPELNKYEKFGGDGSGNVPWFFEGSRQIPNISDFKVPDYAIITNRIKRHAGVALIDAFAGEERDYALTTDLRLIPISKLKPGRGSTFHGVELSEGWDLPVGVVKKDAAYPYKKKRSQFRRIRKRLAYGTPIQLTGEVLRDGKRRYVETEEGE